MIGIGASHAALLQVNFLILLAFFGLNLCYCNQNDSEHHHWSFDSYAFTNEAANGTLGQVLYNEGTGVLLMGFKRRSADLKARPLFDGCGRELSSVILLKYFYMVMN